MPLDGQRSLTAFANILPSRLAGLAMANSSPATHAIAKPSNTPVTHANTSKRSKMLAMRPTASMSRLSLSISTRSSKLSKRRTYLRLHPKSKSKAAITMAPTPKMHQPQAVPQTAARVPPVDQSSRRPRVLPGRMDDMSTVMVQNQSINKPASSITQKRVVTTPIAANTLQQ